MSLAPPQTFFVTGATGFVGRHLCARLRVHGHRVLGLVRQKDAELAKVGVELIEGDILDAESWKGAIAGAHYIIHCAANAAFAGRDYRVNVEGTRQLLEVARTLGPSLERFVFVSTVGAVDRGPADNCQQPLDLASPLQPTSAYGKSKAAAEKLVRASGLRFTIVRPAMVVGADMRAESHFAVFVRAALLRRAFARIAWPGRFGVVDVEDLVSALLVCATHPSAQNGTYFCSGDALSVGEAFTAAAPRASPFPVAWLSAIARVAPWCFPFRAKALLLPALVANDAPLRQLGWQPQRDAQAALVPVIERERARVVPHTDPGGQTVITGAASGLGRALAIRLAPHRRDLLLIDRDAAGLDAIRTRFPQVRTLVADLSDEAAIRGIVDGGEWQRCPIRELFLCAGFGLRGPLSGSEIQRHLELLQVNISARLRLAHAALHGMLRHQFGRIVVISSSSAFQPLPYLATYAASNAALLSLGEAWAAELSGTGVQMLTVCPGGMQTNFQRAAGVRILADEKLLAPEDVADRILAALGTSRTTLIISTRAHAMSWLARLLPRRVSVALWKRLMLQLR